MGIFEKYLTIWVGLAIFLGVVLGNIFPELFQKSFEFLRGFLKRLFVMRKILGGNHLRFITRAKILGR